jgi:hypothetical protein
MVMLVTTRRVSSLLRLTGSSSRLMKFRSALKCWSRMLACHTTIGHMHGQRWGSIGETGWEAWWVVGAYLLQELLGERPTHGHDVLQDAHTQAQRPDTSQISED